MIIRYGGEPGVRDEGTVEHISWISRRLAEAGDVIGAAAALICGIAMWHPFNDGNKRTAIAAAATLLEMQGLRLTVTLEEGLRTMMNASRGDMSRTAIKRWLRDHITDVRVP